MLLLIWSSPKWKDEETAGRTKISRTYVMMRLWKQWLLLLCLVSVRVGRVIIALEGSDYLKFDSTLFCLWFLSAWWVGAIQLQARNFSFTGVLFRPNTKWSLLYFKLHQWLIFKRPLPCITYLHWYLATPCKTLGIDKYKLLVPWLLHRKGNEKLLKMSANSVERKLTWKNKKCANIIA